MGGFIEGSPAIRLGRLPVTGLRVPRLRGARSLVAVGACLFFGACASTPVGEPPPALPAAEPANLALAALEAPPSGSVAEEIRRIQEGPERPELQLRLAHLHRLARQEETAIAICYRLKYDREEPIGPEVEARADLYLARAYLALADEERSRHFARCASEQTVSAEVRAAALHLHRGLAETPRARPRPGRPAPAPATAAGPAAILARTQWGAARPIGTQMGPMGRIQRVTVHHTGPPHVASKDRAESARVLRSIQQIHMEDRHYADIGYHFLIDPAGRVWEGRAISQQGAHAGDDTSNRGNVGICLLGDFRGNQHPTSEQMASLRFLVEHYLDRAGLGPSALVTHQEIRPAHMGITECPGSRLQALVERMRADLRRGRTALGN
jgi:hypothetical protein